MRKLKNDYACLKCDEIYFQWSGQCKVCKSWNTIQEKDNLKKEKVKRKSKLINQFDIKEQQLISSGIDAFDEILSGGIQHSSITLIGGAPGIGKSTLALTLANNLSKSRKVLYVSGEENEVLMHNRLNRLKFLKSNISFLFETSIEKIENEIVHGKFDYIIIDSIQTVSTEGNTWFKNNVNRIIEVTARFVELSRMHKQTYFFIGQITKGGELAGPKSLEHLVDTVIYFEDEVKAESRLLSVKKNRFGPIDKIGKVIIGENGLTSQKKTVKIIKNKIGRAYSLSQKCGKNGEILGFETLLRPSLGQQRIYSSTVSSKKINMLIGVLEEYKKIDLTNFNIYIEVIGEKSYIEEKNDLAILMSILSAYRKKLLQENLIFSGKINLLGEIINLSSEKSLAEILKNNSKLELIGNMLMAKKRVKEINILDECFI